MDRSKRVGFFVELPKATVAEIKRRSRLSKQPLWAVVDEAIKNTAKSTLPIGRWSDISPGIFTAAFKKPRIAGKTTFGAFQTRDGVPTLTFDSETGGSRRKARGKRG